MKSFFASAVVMALVAVLGFACGTKQAGSPLEGIQASVAISPPGPVAADGRQSASLRVTLSDAGGRAVSGLTVHFDSSDPGVKLSADTRTDGSGAATGTLSAIVAGTKTVSVTVSDGTRSVELPEHPQVTFAPGAPADLVFQVQPSKAAEGTSISPAVEVAVRDVLGNAVADGAEVRLSLAGGVADARLGGTVTVTTQNGVARFSDLQVDLACTGCRLLATTANGRSALSDPFEVALAPDPDRSTLVASSGPLIADRTSQNVLTLSVLDVHGLPIAGLPATIRCTASGSVVTPGTGTTDANGRFVARIVSTTAATMTVVATAGDLRKTVDVVFVAGPPSDAETTFTATPSSGVLADGIQTSTLEVTVRDALGNRVPGAGVSLTTTGTDDTLTPASGVTDGSGVFTSALASHQAETKAVTATVSMGCPGTSCLTFSRYLEVEFIQPAVRLTFSVQPGLMHPDRDGTAEASILDASGNVVPENAAVTITFSHNPGGSTLGGAATVNAVNGKASFTFHLDQPGAGYSLTASANGLPETVSHPFDVTRMFWSQSPGTGVNGYVTAVGFSPDGWSAWSGTGGQQIFRSIDSGDEWWNLGAPEDSGSDIRAFAFEPGDPDTVFVATAVAGIWVTHDRGLSWSDASVGLASMQVFALVHTATPGELIVGTWDQGLFQSTDGGASWSPLACSATNVQALALDPSTPGRLYAAGSDGIFRSDDDGATWSTLSTTLAAVSLAVDPANPAHLLAGTSGSGLWTSPDSGASWTQVSSVDTTASVAGVVFVDSARVYAAVRWQGVWVSTDGGGQWSLPAPTGFDVTSVAVDPNDPGHLLAATYGQGLRVSCDSGSSWTLPSLGPAPHQVTAVSSNGLVTYAATSGGMYASTGDPLEGFHWIEGTGLPWAYVYALYADPDGSSQGDDAYAVIWDQGVFKTHDGGATWAESDTGITDTNVDAITGTAGYLVVGSRAGGIFRSPDEGASWAASNAGLTNLSILALAAEGGSSGVLYAGTAGSGVLKSIDQGASWTAANAGISTETVNTLALSRASPGIVWAGTGSGLYVSRDGGGSWTLAGGGSLPAVNILAVGAWTEAQTEVLVSVEGQGLFLSTDGGDTFAAVPTSPTYVDAITTEGSGPTVVLYGSDSLGLWEGIFGA